MASPTQGDAALTAHRDELKRELATLQRRIEKAERAAVDRNVVAAAVEQAQRDRDALTSPAVEDLRETAENLCDSIEHTWTNLISTIGSCEIMASKAPEVALPPALPAALNAAVTARARLLERLAAADIDYLTLPDLPPYSNVLTGSSDVSR